MAEVLSLAVGVLTNELGHMLVVRKKGTKAFMQPGGKIDAGETPKEALKRELFEELSIDVELDAFKWMCQAVSPAANELNTDVVADVFSIDRTQWPEFDLTAEIEEAQWISKQSVLYLAPLTKDKIIPLLKWS